MRLDELNELLDITNEQGRLLENDKYEEFIGLLDKRQGIIDKINELYSDELSIEEKKVLEEIISVDKKNQKVYNGQLEEVRENLRKLNENRNRELNYMSVYTNYGIGRNFDSK